MSSLTRRTFAVAAAALVGATGILTLVTPSADGAQARTVRVVRWIDGDTVQTTRGTVRVIGIDTPERGECGYDAATRVAKRFAASGSRIKLGNPRSGDNRDRYGRSLRYIHRAGGDLGIRQIRHGAKARYDSRDGYDRHPRQAAYRAADRANRDYCGGRPGAGHVGGGGPVSPTGWNCPRRAPIKGNQGSPEWIFHRPGDAYYNATNPEECFRTAAAARAAGYRAARI